MLGHGFEPHRIKEWAREAPIDIPVRVTWTKALYRVGDVIAYQLGWKGKAAPPG